MLKGVDRDMIGYTFKNFHLRYDSINKLTGSGSYKAKVVSPDCSRMCGKYGFHEV